MWYSRLKIAGVKEDVLRIVGGDNDLLNQIRQMCPEPKFQTAIAYFLIKGINSDQLSQYVQKLSKIQQAQKLKSLFVSKSGVHFNDKIFTDWISFTEAVDGLMPPPTLKDLHEKHQASEDTLISGGKNIEVHKAQNVVDACNLGKGMSWCISQPGNTMYQSYRDTQASTFYFIIDNNRDASDPLHRVVLDMTEQGPELTDVNNTTGSIAEFGGDADSYLDYLAQHGVDTSIFVNDPITPEEEKENRELAYIPSKMSESERSHWFKNLSFEYKSKFIGRGNELNFEELNYLVSSNLKDLVNQYLNIGYALSSYQFALISNNNQFLKTYLRARSQMLENSNVPVTQEDLQIPNFVIPLFEAGKISFSRMPFSLTQDPEFALKAWEDGLATYQNLPKKMRIDTDFAFKAWKSGKAFFRDLPESLRENPKIALEAWNRGDGFFYYLPDSYKNDPEFVMKSIKEKKVTWNEIPKIFQQDPKFQTEVLKLDHSDSEKLNIQVFARENPDFALLAWNMGKLNFFDLPESFKEDPEFALKAWKSGRCNFYELPTALQRNVEIGLEAWNRGNVLYHHLPQKLKKDREIAMQALNGSGFYSHLPPSVQIAMQAGGGSSFYSHLPRSLQNDPDFALEALNSGSIVFEDLPRLLKQDPRFEKFRNPQ